MQILSQKFKIKKSYLLCIVFLLIHIGAAICLCFIEFVLWWKIILVICFLLNLIFVVNHYALLNSPNSIVEFWRNNVGDWYFKKKSGDIEIGFLDPPLFISNNLVVLSFIADKKISIPIAKDSFYTNDDFRKFKMLLKVIKQIKEDA